MLKLNSEQLIAIWSQLSGHDSNLALQLASAEQWQSVTAPIPSMPVDYLWPVTQYYHQYNLSYANEAIFLPIVLTQQQQVIAIWPVNLVLTYNGWQLQSNSGPLLCPLFLSSHLSLSSRKKIIKRCITWLIEIAHGCHIKQVQACQLSYFDSDPNWALTWMSHGASLDSQYESLVDLTMSPNQYKKHITKGALADIKKALNLWRYEYVTHMSETQRDKFAALHLNAAGKVTRSKESWESQRQLINQGVSFAIFAYDELDSLIGAAQFIYGHGFSTYAFAAYDRSLFKLPIAHGAQQLAMDFLKQRGMSCYLLGQRCFAGESPPPTPKERSIGDFKSSFATDYQLKHIFSLAIMKDH
ncbi:hypothetical protein [Motilimonas sp. KMU-193]|uniref:hypothetical protein n=1 Tax=Motilimonas sp. KMU-193 TaxID=3388668 RepID=UPI00396B3203